MNVTFVVLVALLGLTAIKAIPKDDFQENETINIRNGAEKCSEAKGVDNVVSCVAMSTLRKLEDLSVKEQIEIFPGVELSSDIPKYEREVRQQRNMNNFDMTEGRIGKIFDMMFAVMNNLFSERTLKIKMSEETSNAVMRSIEEGRGKMKKFAGPLMMALGAKLMALVPILLGGLALLVTKALVVSKLALVLALIVGAQTLFSGGSGGFFNRFGQGGWAAGGHGGGHNYVAYGAPNVGSSWNSGSSQAYPYARSLDAQKLAYSAQQ